MSKTVNKLYKHNAIVYKVILFLITASAIVYFFPKGGQFKYDFSQGKPWQYNNLIAPFDFAIEKTPEQIEEEIKRIDVNAKQYFLYDENVVQEVNDDYAIRLSLIQSNDSLSGDDIETMRLLGQSIIASVYDRGFLEPSNSGVILDKTQVIALKKGTQVEDIIYNSLFTSREVSELIRSRLGPSPYNYAQSVNLTILSEIIKPNVSFDNEFTQKVIEEAPAPGLSDTLRKEMGEAAVRCALAINYRGAGTVEFLLCGDEFFFMEMNTRLQVEHPVTEMVTGVDLVNWQINIAAGDTLPLTQSDIQLQGHSFEARIYAEDPSNDFIPCSGVIESLNTPLNSEFVRIDTGIEQGDEISPYYDPMIAKLIVHDDNREQALGRLRQALGEFHLAGFSTNIGFLSNLAHHPTFNQGAPSTHFIAEQGDSLVAVDGALLQSSELVGAFAYLCSLNNEQAQQHNGSPWQQLSGFNLNSPRIIKVPFKDLQLSAIKTPEGFNITHNNTVFNLQGTCIPMA